MSYKVTQALLWLGTSFSQVMAQDINNNTCPSPCATTVSDSAQALSAEQWRFEYLSCACTPCWSPSLGLGSVLVSPSYSVDMLSRTNYRAVKPLILLSYLQDYPGQDVILSAQMRPVAFFATTNEKDKFAYLGRFPPHFWGKSASVADINDFAFALTYSPASWVHGYWELLASDAITFVTDPRQGTLQNSKMYAVVGDFNKTPLYFTIGKRDISFGQLYTVNPFSAPVTWHYFGAMHDGCAAGYYNGGLYLEASAINGGRGIRVADTNRRGKLDNWAVNGRYQWCNEQASIALGGGFLHSTIYDGPEAEHEGPVSIGPRNAAWNVNLEASYKNFWGYAEFFSTSGDWLATCHPVRAFSAGISYCLPACHSRAPLVFSLEYGEGIQGAKGTPWRKNVQAIFGIDYLVWNNCRFCFEYIHTRGFVPLIDITEPCVSSQCTRGNVFLLGLTLNI